MSDAIHSLLAATTLLDLHHPDIEALVASRGWRALRPHDRIGAVYDFVRNHIAFGSTASRSTSRCRRVRSPEGRHRRRLRCLRQPRCFPCAPRLQPVGSETPLVRRRHPPPDEPQRGPRPRVEVVKPHGLVTLRVPIKTL